MQQSRSLSAAIVAFAFALFFAFPSLAQNCQPDVVVGPAPGVEPTLAVNPFDPQNIAAAYINADPNRVELRVSTDGGETWSQATLPEVPEDWEPLPGGTFPTTDPVLTFDGSGRLFWGYLGTHDCSYCVQAEGCPEPCACFPNPQEPFSSCSDVLIAEVDPDTGTILEVFQATPTLGFTTDKPWLAADTFAGSDFFDRLYLVWFSQDKVCNPDALCLPLAPLEPFAVRFSYSSDLGETWSEPQVLDLVFPNDPGQFINPNHVAVGPPPTSSVYVAFHVADSLDNSQAEIGWVQFARNDFGGAAGSLGLLDAVRTGGSAGSDERLVRRHGRSQRESLRLVAAVADR